MVVASAADHGVFLERAQSGGGFARVDDASALVAMRPGDGPVMSVIVDGVDRVHEGGGHGGDAAHALGEVEGDAFGGEQVTYRTFHGGEDLAALESLPVRDQGRDADTGILRREGGREHGDAAHHASLACGEVRRAGFVRGDCGLAGDVAVGRVFGERRLDGGADDVLRKHDRVFLDMDCCRSCGINRNASGQGTETVVRSPRPLRGSPREA